MKKSKSKNLSRLLFSLTILILLTGVAMPALASTSNLQAYPDTPLEAMLFAPFAVTHQVPQPNPAAIQIEVGAHDGIMLTPTVEVDPADVGATGSLLMYIYLPDFQFGLNIPGKSVTLGDTQLIDLVPPLDFSNYIGLKFIVYCGYVNAAGAIMYNAYTVNVVDYSLVPQCSGLDQTTCGSTENCTWNPFPTGSCVIDCAQFTDEGSCINAFDGNTCHWTSTPFGDLCAQ